MSVASTKPISREVSTYAALTVDGSNTAGAVVPAGSLACVPGTLRQATI